MKITLLTTTLEGGGAARVMVNMANLWAQRGRDISLISFEDGSQQPFYPVDERVRLKYLSLNKFSNSLRESITNNCHRLATMRRVIMADRPDVILSFIDTANVRTIVSLLGSKVPVVVSERIHPAYEPIGRFWSAMRLATYPLADCVVVQTSNAATFFRHKAIRRLRVIPNPVLPLDSDGTAPELPPNTILAVGRLYEQKGYPFLLDAFARASRNISGWNLCIAGEGPERPWLKQRIRELGLDGKVRLLGQVADVKGLLGQAQAYVMSSVYEGFPNSLCEAMAEGLPCISTDCPSGPADIVRHDMDGLLVPVNDANTMAEALQRIMSDSALRTRLGNTARAVKERFSPDAVLDMWDDCFRETMQHKRVKP